MFLSLLLLWTSFSSRLFSRRNSINSNNETNQEDHLVILSNGIFGTSGDLSYLHSQLTKKGCFVLQSSVNENLRTLYGVEKGGCLLAEEVLQTCRKYNSFRRISFVGNSLGGLYARYAVRELFDPSLGLIAGLQPQHFVTIATPHLGVRNFTYLDVPDNLKILVSTMLLSTGKDLFQTDAEGKKTLLYNMATDPKFLIPLESFKSRRMYANLDNDFVVPLGTAACIQSNEVHKLRSQLSKKYGIVVTLSSSRKERPSSSSGVGRDLLDEMIESLDSCGWEKVIINFQGILPLSHNKICALSRSPEFITQTVLGFSEGRFVMDHASDYIATSLDP